MTEPTKIQRAIALNGLKTTSIPITDPALGDGKACYDKGFGLLNFTPKASGGIPPWGADMNGFLFDISNNVKFMNSGGEYLYDSAHQTAISGYPIGALLRRADGMGYWQSTVDGNMTNPDTGGAGWVSISTQFYASAGGTSDAITATFVPSIASWIDGQTFFVKISSANTTTVPTISPNGLTAKTIVKMGGTALSASDLVSGMIAEFKYSSTLDKAILQNPATANGNRLIGIQVITSTQTYTPTPGTVSVIVEIIGGGAAGGSCAAATGGTVSAGGGGGAGAYAKVKLTSGFSGVTVTIGTGGAPAAAGANAGGNGGTSSFGALISCPGGSGVGTGGAAITATSVSNSSAGGAGGAAPSITGTTIVAYKGDTGKGGFAIPSTTVSIQTGSGGVAPLGVPGYAFNSSVAGIAAGGYGAGGSGGGDLNTNTARQGGAGAPGVCIVWEYS